MPVSVICKTCEKEFKVKPYKVKEAKFCSRECRKTKIKLRCKQCDSVFFETPYRISNGKGKFCSIKCYRIDQNANIKRICKQCNSVFHVSPARVNGGKDKFCSKRCYEKSRGGKIERICEYCESTFLVYEHRVKIGEGRFCSKRCTGSYSVSISGGKRSSLEIKVEKKLTDLGFNFESQKRIGQWLTDFYISDLNLVIECDGEYWHSLPDVIIRDKRKNAWLKKNGYKLIRLKESEIREDVEACLIKNLPSLQTSLF